MEDNELNNSDNNNEETAEASSQKPNEEGNSISSDLIRGHINTIILRALYERDKYGYEIMSDIEQKSHGQYSLKQPTLYSALKRLENQGYIKAYWKTDEVSSGGRRKYFTLTESGKEITEKNLAEWEYSRTIIDSLISDRSFDFSQPAPTPVDFHILKNSVSRVPIVRSDEADRATQENGAEGEKPVSDESQTQSSSPATESTNETVIHQIETVSTETQQVTYIINDNLQTAQPERDALYSEQIHAAQEQAAQTQPQQPPQEQQPIRQEEPLEQTQRQESEPQTPSYEQAQQQAQPEREFEQTQQPQEQQHTAASAQRDELSAQEEARRIAHENYLRLISEPVRSEPVVHHEDIVPNSENVNMEGLLYNNRPETERDYKNLIDGIFNRAIANGRVQTTYKPVETPPPPPEPARKVRLVDRGRADGVTVTTSNKFDSESTYATKTTYNKGLTMLKCSAIVLAVIVIESIFCFIFQNQMAVNWFYPTVLLGIGVIQFAVFGIMTMRGYGKNCVRPTTNGYISSCVILTIISILIICALSFLLNINFTLASDVVKMIVIPSITALNITVFAVCFKLFIK